MLQVRSPILYFLLLVLGILLNLGPDTSYKQGRFPKTLLEKSLQFLLSKKNDIVAFDFSLILLLIEIDSIPEEQSRKRDALRACGTGRIEIVFAFLTEVIALYVEATIV